MRMSLQKASSDGGPVSIGQSKIFAALVLNFLDMFYQHLKLQNHRHSECSILFSARASRSDQTRSCRCSPVTGL